MSCRLTLLLPASLALAVPEGRHCPCLMGCLLTVGRGGFITIDGPSREKVFEQADRFLRALIRRNHPPPMSIAATLTSPCGVRDGWQVIVNAEISFAPTSIEATVFDPEIENNGNLVRLVHDEERPA